MGGDLFSSRSLPDPFVGRTFDGRYQVLERLGAGGVGMVYRGRQAKLGRFVAIKVLQRDTAALPEWRRRFEREGKALSALAHPNVVSVTDFGIDGGVAYLVMELLQGKTLADLIKEGPVPPARALDIVRQTLRGLAFAHGKGIVHRDLKPANIFLQALPDHADHVRLLDFGMAKFLEDGGTGSTVEALTRVGAVFGTPSHMSPEQAKAEAVDVRTDVYAAGVILFQLLAGRLPFTGDAQQMMKGHVFDPVPSLTKLRPDLSIAPLVQPIVERAMAKKPAARFPDAESMLAALESSGASARLAAETRRRGRGPIARAARVAVGLGLLLGATVAVVAVLRGDLRWPSERATRPPARPTETKAPAPRSPRSPIRAPAPPPPAVKPASPPPAATPAPPEPLPPDEEPGPPEAPAPAAARIPTPAPIPSRTAEAPRPPARNPWRQGVPRALKPIRDRLERGGRTSQASLKPAYAFARENPGDPRPWLLLGRAYAQLDWLSDSMERYLRAYREDPAARGDPQMLADLLKAAEHPVAGRNAAKAIREVYGAEAIPALDKAIKRRAADKEASARLVRLRESLASDETD